MANANRVAAGARKPVNTFSNFGVALLFAGTLFLTANASISAHPMSESLPTLRPDYGGISPDGTGGAFLDSVGSSWNAQLFLVNASLVHLLPSGEVAPDLASWSISKNHLVYTFTIRKDARFSNGHDVTAEDAAFSFQRVLMPSANPESELTYLGLIRGTAAYAHGTAKTLTGVKVVNARTLQLTITKQAAYFLEVLTISSVVFDRSVVAGKPLGDPSNQFSTNYLTNTCTGNQGAGPFMFVCHDRSSALHSFYSGRTPKYTLVPNPYYYGRKPHIRLELISTGTSVDTIPDNYKAYIAGTLDVAYVPISEINRWRSSTQYHQFPSSLIIFFTPNVHLAPFDNVHCRLALAHALDRETLFNTILHGQAHPTYAIVPRGMLGYYAGNDNPHYDLSKARSEIAKCPGRTVPMALTVPATYADRNAGHFVVRGFRDAGFNSKLKVVSDNDWGTIVSQPLDNITQLVFNAWSQDYPDPQDYCTRILRSGSPSNASGWHNAAYDRLVDQAEVVLDPKKRAQLYIQAQHIALSQGAFISLSNNFSFALIKPYVHGLIGTETQFRPQPKDGDWANVSISKH